MAYDPKKGYDASLDYSATIEQYKAQGRDTTQLEKERAAKINDPDGKYKGNEPNMYNSNQTYTQASNNRTGTSTSSGGTTMSNQQAISNAIGTATKVTGYDYSPYAATDAYTQSVNRQQSGGQQPAAPDYSQYAAPQTQQNYNYANYVPFDATGSNYAADAEAAAARGDWGAVAMALAQRAAKINAQGGNDRGLSNDALLNQLKQKYGNSYNSLSTRDQDFVTLYSGGTVYYDNGDPAYHAGTGWVEGKNYLQDALNYAKAGDLDGAYDALMRRGFKMQDTGSTGGGTTQAQAYAMVHQMWMQSTSALDTWAREKTSNQENLKAAGVLDAKINPTNAYKTLVKNGYNVVYDGNGAPIYAYRRSNKVGTNGGYIKYKPEEIEALKAYYQSENPDEYPTLYMNRHNARYDANNRQPWFDGYGAKYDTTTGMLQLSDSDVPVYNRDITANDLSGTMNPVQLVQPGAPNGVGVQNLPTMGGVGGVGGGGSIGSVGGVGGGSVGGGSVGSFTPGTFGDYLDEWYNASQQQQTNTIDYGTNQAVLALLRQQQDAEATFQEQRNQIALDEAIAKDNQALYAETRGDKGGIGAAQYDSIMNTAAQNRLSVNSAQQKLATDTARQIADLRAQGEYEKADALLSLSQTYLSQLISLEQWAMEYNLSAAQFNESLKQWDAEYRLKVASITGYYDGSPTLQYQQYQNELALNQQERLAEDGWTLLSAGIPPSASQLAAMGITQDQANSYLTAAQLAAASGNKGKGSGVNPSTDPGVTEMDLDGLFEAASQNGGYSWLKQKTNYKAYGLDSAPSQSDYDAWVDENVYDEDDISSIAQGLMTDIKKYHGSSNQDMLDAVEKNYKAGSITWKEYRWLCDQLGI